MTQTNGVAILATQLADTDRRALSQAWYSALHLATHDRSTPPYAVHRTRTALAPPAVQRHVARAGRHDEKAGPKAPAIAGRRAGRAPAVEVPPAERRAPKSLLARRIERALVAPPTGRAGSFVVTVAEGRVHVLVRLDGGRLRLVALCAPALRTRVERALAQARYALATRGVRAEAP